MWHTDMIYKTALGKRLFTIKENIVVGNNRQRLYLFTL